MNNGMFSLNPVLCKVVESKTLDRNEIRFLLGLKDPKDVELLQRVARLVRSRIWGKKAFIFGGVCLDQRQDNQSDPGSCQATERSVLEDTIAEKEILDAALHLRDIGVHFINLTKRATTTASKFHSVTNRLSKLVEMITHATELPVLISPDTIPSEAVTSLVISSSNWWTNRQPAESKYLGDPLEKITHLDIQADSKIRARSHGILIEERGLTGGDESIDDIADAIEKMKNLKVTQAKAISFMPKPNSSLQQRATDDSRGSIDSLELNFISVMRLVFKDALIFLSPGSEGLIGLKKQLLSGANAVSCIPPRIETSDGFADHIDDSGTMVIKIHDMLQSIGMELASADEFRSLNYSRPGESNSAPISEPVPAPYLYQHHQNLQTSVQGM